MLAVRRAEPQALPALEAKCGECRIIETLMRSGAVIIERAVPRQRVSRIAQSLAPYFAHAPLGEGLFLGRKTRRFSGLIAKSPLATDLVLHPLVLEIVETVLGLGTTCDCVQLHLTQAISICPGERAQVLHRDDTAFPFPHDFELMLNAMWPMDTFTSENGATEIVPGSHRWDRALRPAPDEAVPALAEPGSMILWLGSVFHGGGANRSARPRRGLVFSYSLGWLAQAEKLLLSTPPDIARTLPERAQRLIGYQVHRPNLGWIEERDPIEWLNGEVGALASAQDHFTPELKSRLAAALGEA